MKKAWHRLKWKNKLINTFITGNIYNDITYSDGQKIRHLPTVKEVHVFEHLIEYVIELNHGIDPKLFKEKSWLFEQLLGDVQTIELYKSKFIILKIEK